MKVRERFRLVRGARIVADKLLTVLDGFFFRHFGRRSILHGRVGFPHDSHLFSPGPQSSSLCVIPVREPNVILTADQFLWGSRRTAEYRHDQEKPQ